jgi:TonB-linked SusC/RagA family outer membrane protein
MKRKKLISNHYCKGSSNLWATLLLLFLFIPISMNAQTVKFTSKTVSIKTAISEIRKQANYSVDYTGKMLDLSKSISVSKGNNSVLKVMDKIVGNNMTYTINGRHIIIMEKKNNPSTGRPTKASQRAGAATHTLKGVVVDGATSETLIGASVRVEDSNNGMITDVNGEFTINNVSPSDELTVSYIGYKTRKVLVGDLATMTIKLESADDQVGEVIVVGSGTQRKVSVTGAITAIKGNELYAPSSSLTNNLAGKLSGIISVTNSGEPGSTSSFYIRGISTFGGRTTPLILLDGVEISSEDLNNIPAESIESFSILKDASATAIYGARGANGVMLITTKTGTENSKANINVTVETSMLKPVNVVDFADGATYMKTYNEALLARNPNAEPRYSDEQIANTMNKVNPYVYPDVDWYDLMYKKYTTSQRGNINVQGGGSRVTYYMSLQANHDGGILDVPKTYSFDNNYNRWLYTFQNNIGYKITSTTKVDLKMNAQISNMKSPNNTAAGIFNQIYYNTPVSFPAVFPAEEGDQHLRFGTAVMSAGRFYTNPYANMLNSYKETNANKLNISLNINQKFDFILKGLSATALVNFNNYSSTYYTRSLSPFLYTVTEGSWFADDPSKFSTTEVLKGTEYISQSDVTRYSDNTFYFDGRLNYDQHFGKHSVTAMLMYMMREFRSDVLPNRNQGFSGRFTYDYDSKYLAEFNFGYNGTERLKDHRFEFFPAISLGWVISSENFWKPVEKYMDYLKIRSSYGIVGSDETGANAGAAHFLYLNSVNMGGGYSFSSGYQANTTLQGPIVTSYAVTDPHWERAREFDVGLDMRIFGQVNFSIDYYHNKRNRILMKRASFPAILGYSNAIPWSNIGKVDNKGIELSFNWKKQLTNDFGIDIRGTYTYAKNKYVYVDEPDYPYTWQTNTGKPLSHLTGYVADGLFKDQKDIDTHADQSIFGSTVMPGDIKYRDINGDGKITAEDQVMLSPYGSTPRIQYGFGISMTYKKADFSVFFTGSAKRNIMLSNIYPFCANDTNDRNLMQWIADNHWSEGADNTNAAYPRLGILGTQIANNTQSSSYWMRCGNFLRFKTLEIGYTFPYCRVYLSGDNIAVWSPLKYWDPELSYTSYPLQRTFNLGVQFKF